jgi:hypothetical protein
MDVAIVWGDYNGCCADFEGFGTTGTSDRVGTDDQVDVGGRVYRGEEFGGQVGGKGGAVWRGATRCCVGISRMAKGNCESPVSIEWE